MATTALNPRAVRGFNCPSCGAAVVLRGFAWTQTVACESCGAVIDAKDPNLAILHEAQLRLRVRPLIPLGTRGEWHGAPYEVIGFQQRTITADGVDYSWREYLLFNPYRGFRYLTEYDGHWNDVVPVPGLPVVAGRIGQSVVTAHAAYDDARFRLFQTARARTTFIIGEFPWEVRQGDAVEVQDYVAPPRVLSAERTSDETTWSLGTYVDGQAIWRAFKLDGAPPTPVGIYSNQPSPYAGSVGAWWKTFVVLVVLLLATFVVRFAIARRERVYEGRFTLAAPYVIANPDSVTTMPAFVTPRFTIPGADANVVVETSADIDNEWIFLDMSLVDVGTGRTYDLGREVSYYHGRDSDGSWSEGNKRDRATIPAVPGGTYQIRVTPSGQPRPGGAGIPYTLRVIRDVPSGGYYLAAFVLLLIPPIVGTYRAAKFETQRWAESDTGSAIRSSMESSDDE
jgi:hypothetical protein